MGKLIGLTGSIGSGKSTVAAYFEQKGAAIINADRINAMIFEKNQAVQESIQNIFGTLDKTKIAGIVFSDDEKRKQLEKILHPAIMKEVLKLSEELFSKGKKMVLLEASQLVEAGFYKKLYGLILVICKPSIQKKRFLANAEKKNLHPLYDKILKAQMPASQKKRFAHWVIDNSGDLKKTQKEVDKVWEQIQKL